ncbi:MAG TPA: type III-A CRISPR-associated RAMP protein Csm3 [Nanoarchaeota archaeon]|nr:type III-A CRISPR-associated RAMP protein Csm3 [Nanoarchaeota archaeon]
MQLKKKIKIELVYTNLTGLRIGGNKEEVKIGGIDNPIIKIKDNNKEFAYIPGSSLKGKIRSLLEKKGYAYKDNNNNKEKPCGCSNCDVCKLFGPHNSESEVLRRLIFRDSNYIEMSDILEEKIENIINRLSGTAKHPRKQERLVPGVVFKQEVIFDVYDEKDSELFKTFLEGLELLENDYLGGSGSRGYGKIKFLKIRIEDLDSEEDEEISENSNIENLDKLPLKEVKKLANKESILNKKDKLIEKFEEFISGKNGNSNN